MSCYAFERKPKEATRSQILVYCDEFPANVIVAARADNDLPGISRKPTLTKVSFINKIKKRTCILPREVPDIEYSTGSTRVGSSFDENIHEG